jgi:hypothetical protein
VRRLVVWIAVTVGLAALVRRLRRRHDTPSTGLEAPAETPPAAGADANDPAEELRRKLQETRDDEPAAATLGERRADVHDEGRAALDEMQRSTED